MNYEEEKGKELDILELAGYLLHRAGVIVLVGALFASLAIAYKVFLNKPEYTSTTKLYVINRQSSGNTDSVTTSDLQSSALLTADYVNLIRMRSVMESVIARLELDMSYNELLDKVSVSSGSNSRIISIKVTDQDPYLAWQIAGQIQKAASQNICSVVKTDAISVADQPDIPYQPSNAVTIFHLVIAAIVGMFLTAVVLSVMYLMDDKFSTAEDASYYLGLGTLGMIPLNDELVKDKKRRMKQRRRSRHHSSKRAGR